ncbi:MAG: 3-oxoacyl-[acyl-carrier-protein] synthase III C-terminal domain-containing protein [Dehalococcoidia bacterium]|nr:3-oxoacyl-[acyl-carrier-protein] synthase III C-terminal domain-containing protein [Dehalococcoidia bacterium]
MIGITSFGGYIPRLRLSRKSIFQSIGWLNPATGALSQGEKATGNWDEDSVTMAVAAVRDCLVGQNKKDIDSLYLASTTLPFADRQNAGIVATALNLRDDIHTTDIASSQRAGISALIAGLRDVKSGESKTVVVAAADMREAKCGSNYEMLFGDGAAAVLLGAEDVVAEFKGSYSVSYDFVDHYRGKHEQFDHTWEERWTRDEGYVKIVPEAINGLLAKLGVTMAQVDKLVFSCFFKREHAAIAKAVGASPEKVVDNLHEVCGETGAAHPLVMLVSTLEAAKPGERILVAGYGQGCEALYFQVTDKILDLPRCTGIRGSLANKLATDSYMKFLAFRNLLPTDLGARAEVAQPTALSTLWRDRKMILGLVGGKCQTCGTPQFPKADICVNPECGAVGTQAPYEFADEPAIVKTFTGDMLAASIDPPNIFGMVQFKDGGRFMSDFTDCKLAEIKVGMPMRMTFRKHLDDRGRGFTGYFWKAVPVL